MLQAWVAAGFSPAEFWQQTPDSFHAATVGIRQRREMEWEQSIRLSHTQSIMFGLASVGKLPDVEKFLPRASTPKVKPQTLDEVMGKWAALASAGYPIKIEGAAHGD